MNPVRDNNNMIYKITFKISMEKSLTALAADSRSSKDDLSLTG